MEYLRSQSRKVIQTRLPHLVFLGAVLGIAVSTATAQNVSPHYEKHAVLEGEAGDWIGSTTIDGREYKARATNRWAPGKSCLVIEETYWPVDEPEKKTTLKGVIGWDEASRCVLSLWFGSEGVTAISRLTVDGSRLVGRRTGTGEDGAGFTSDEILEHKPGVYRVKIRNMTVGDEVKPDITVEFKQTTVDDVAETAAGKWMNHLVGQWEYEWSDGRHGTMEFAARAGNRALVGTRTDDDGSTAVQLGSVDISSGALVDTGYASDRTQWKIEYTDFTDTTMRGPYVDLVQPDGTRLDGAFSVIEKVDHATLKGALVVVDEDGEQTLRTPTLRRKAQ